MRRLNEVREQLLVAIRAFRVLLSAPGTLVYPVASGTLGVVMPFVLAGVGFLIGPRLVPVSVLAYLVGYPVVFAVLMVAYCYEVDTLFDGRSPAFASGLHRSASRLGTVVASALLFLVGGMVAKFTDDWVPFGGVVGITSARGLQIAGVFLFPLVATTQRPLREAIEEVTTIASNHWGKSAIATVGTRALGMVIFWSGMVVSILLAVLAALGVFAVEIPPLGGYTLSVLLPVASLVAALTVGFTVDGVVRTALYRYAIDGDLPPALGGDPDSLLAESGGTSTGERGDTGAVDRREPGHG